MSSALDRGHTDRRKIDACFLDGLGGLGQHTQTSFRPSTDRLGQLSHTPQHRVGALLGFHGKDEALADDRALPYVEPSDLTGDHQRLVDIRHMRGRWGDPTQASARQGHFAHHLVRAFDLEAFLLELV